MKTIVLFYSYSGKTKAIAEALAESEPADMAEIKDVRRPGKLKAYTAGILAAAKGKAWPIKPLGVHLASYDRLLLLSPVWADNPAPPFNAVLAQLPEGKAVSVKMVSMSGKSKCRKRIEDMIEAKGGVLESFEDVKA